VIGNPPWDRMKLQEVEWFAARRPQIALAQRAADRKKMIAAMEKSGDPLWHDYRKAAGRAEAATRVARANGQFPLLSRGDIDLYALFVEKGHSLIKQDGIVGFLVPSGIASDLNTSAYFRQISTASRLHTLFDFANKRHDGSNFFPDVYYRFKFCVIVAGGQSRKFSNADCGFYLRDVRDSQNSDKVFTLSPQDFTNVNPNTGTAPVFQSQRDAVLTAEIHKRTPILSRHSGADSGLVWPISYVRMFDMANDSRLFRSREELTKDGYYPVSRNRLKKGALEMRPLYEGKMVQAFDHRAADIVTISGNLFRPGQSEATNPEDYRNPDHLPNPRYFVDLGACNWPTGLEWAIGFKDVTSVTNARTMIASLIPHSAVGHTLPLIFPIDYTAPKSGSTPRSDAAIAKAVAVYKENAPLILANFNSLPFDYLLRQKVQGNHLTWFILEQLPVVPEAGYARKFGKKTAREIVRDLVLKLTYVSNDMAPFAKDMGYDGKPFVWDPASRRHARAKLDALYFHLYDIAEDDICYILGTFPIVKREDETAFGKYLSEELVLGYWRALAAGDPDAVIAA
jgi:hypothetical protein